MWLAVGHQALLASLAGGFVADRRHGGHVEHTARLGATAPDAATAPPLSRIAVEGCQAEQSSGLPTTDAAEFGHLSAEAGGRDGAAARHRLDDGGPPGQLGISGDAVQHALTTGGNVGL